MALGSYDTGMPQYKAPNLQELMGKELENSFNRVRNKYAEPKMQADIALSEAQAQKAQREGGLGGLTGSMGNAAKLYGLEQEHGSEHPLIQALKRMQDLEQERERGVLDWQKAQIGALPTRLLTAEGKAMNELSDLKEGYKLGTRNTDNPEKLPAAEQNFQRAQYEMGLLNKVTDAGQRDRLRASADVHTTLGLINPKEAFKYSGAWGGLAKKLEQGASALTGKESEDYAAFEENMTRMKLVAKQLSRFFGASASEGTQEDIAAIANPNSWKHSPKIAERKFNTLVKLFELESNNLREAVHNPSFYGGGSPGAYAQEEEPMQPDVNKVAARMEQQSSGNGRTVTRYLDGQKLNIPEHLVAQFDEAHR